MSTCPICSASDPTASVLINQSPYDGKGISEDDVIDDITNDIEFTDSESVVSVSICAECYGKNAHLDD